MNTIKTLLGFVIGVAAGAVVAILFAPDKGSATRKKLFGKGGEAFDREADLADKAADLRHSNDEDFMHISDNMANNEDQEYEDFLEQKAKDAETKVSRGKFKSKRLKIKFK